MTIFRFIKTACLVFLAFSLVVLTIIGCNQDNAMNPFQNNNDSNSGTFGKKIKTFSTNTTSTGTYPQIGSCEVKYFSHWNAYEGGLINIPNGSQFSFVYGALTPPQGYPAGNRVTITMQVDKDAINQQLIYTFEPSGCQFDPTATLWVSWSDLSGSGIPDFFMIDENGIYHLQAPEEVNLVGKTLRVAIPHFSRYAVAFSQ